MSILNAARVSMLYAGTGSKGSCFVFLRWLICALIISEHRHVSIKSWMSRTNAEITAIIFGCERLPTTILWKCASRSIVVHPIAWDMVGQPSYGHAIFLEKIWLLFGHFADLAAVHLGGGKRTNRSCLISYGLVICMMIDIMNMSTKCVHTA